MIVRLMFSEHLLCARHYALCFRTLSHTVEDVENIRGKPHTHTYMHLHVCIIPIGRNSPFFLLGTVFKILISDYNLASSQSRLGIKGWHCGGWGLEIKDVYQPDENILTVQLFSIFTIVPADLDNLDEHQPSVLPEHIAQSRDGNFLL